MATYSRKLTHHATVTAAATDTITMTGPDRSSTGPADPPSSATSATGAAAVNGGRIYNAGTVDLWYTYAKTAGAAGDPTSTATEGVRRLPAGMTDKFDEQWAEVVFKVTAAADCAYSIETNV